MHSHLLHEAYKAHYQLHQAHEAWRLAPNDAILFGADEFVIDHQTRKITFKALGDKSFSADAGIFDAPFVPGWLGLIQDQQHYKIVFAQCDPFSQNAIGVLPHVDGIVKAIPMAAMTSALAKSGVDDLSKVALHSSLNRSQRRELARVSKSSQK